MVYFPNIPQGTDKPSQSYVQIASNFTDLDTVFNNNHIGFSQPQDRGEHRRVTFNSVIADPGAANPKANLYIKTAGGSSQLFFENFNNALGANVQRQMTNLTIVNAGTNHGVTLPSGIILNWGNGVCAGGIATVTFAVAYTVGTVAFPVVCGLANSASNNNAVVDIGSLPTNTSFRVRTTQATGQFYYYAIGS